MEEQLIEYRTAKLAKEKGFNVSCFAYFYNSKPNNDILGRMYSEDTAFLERPTQSLLQKWLRKKHEIHLIVQSTFSPTDTYVAYVNGEIIKDKSLKELKKVGDLSGIMLDHKLFGTYEEALEEALYKALTTIKKD